MLAMDYGWTPAVVDRLDHVFVVELLSARSAKADAEQAWHDLTPEQRTAKERHREIARKLHTIDQKERSRRMHR